MGKRSLLVMVCALSVSCGTFRNFYNDTDYDLPHRQPYGGVQIDVIMGVDMFSDERCDRSWPSCFLQRVFVGPYLLSLDLVGSALFDTLTLPATSSEPATTANDSPQ